MGTMQRQKRIRREETGRARFKVLRLRLLDLLGRYDLSFLQYAHDPIALHAPVWSGLHEGNLDIERPPLSQDWAWAWRVQTRLPPEFEAAIFSDLDSLYDP